MAAYRRVYDFRHLQADCQEPGSAPEPYGGQSSMGYLSFSSSSSSSSILYAQLYMHAHLTASFPGQRV